MRFDVFTLFPGIVAGPLDESILRRAQDRGLVSVTLHDIRDWTTDKHRTADDTPYGGGAGMVMSAPPIVSAVEETLGGELAETRIVVMSAGGRPFTQAIAHELVASRRIALICGRYEGIDARAIEILGAEEISIGDYVLTGGELAAAVVIDAVARLVPGVIESASILDESFQEPLLEYPHYTRPREFRGLAVPEVLLNGNHAAINRWRRDASLRKTAQVRPDLLQRLALTDGEAQIVAEALGEEPYP
ncbi:MAG: tRNA (guanosine(37)-N1)-methyltransferase TrmD [Chloroflexota bacterium]|nr:tRNA (guanosine(37)-N1)-methyltransferase TrmD [Chloroflexota bacterium]